MPNAAPAADVREQARAIGDAIIPALDRRYGDRLAAVERQLDELRALSAEGPPLPNGRRAAAARDGRPSRAELAEIGEWAAPILRAGPAIFTGDVPGVTLVNGQGELRAELTGEEVELGGALVPDEFLDTLLMAPLTPSRIRRRARVIRMRSSSMQVPVIRDESHADGMVYGGIEFQWTEALAEIEESEPEFGQVGLTARGLLGLTEINNSLLDDAPMVGELIMDMFATGSSWIEERAFLTGDGVGKPLGVLNSPAAVEVAPGNAGAVTLDEIDEMESRLLPGSWENAVWVAHPRRRRDLQALNRGNVSAYLIDRSRPIPASLDGAPIWYDERMPAPGTRGSLALIDFAYYLVGDRQRLSLAASGHAGFTRNATMVRGVVRVDGQGWLPTALTPAGGGDPLSPFVVLNG